MGGFRIARTTFEYRAEKVTVAAAVAQRSTSTKGRRQLSSAGVGFLDGAVAVNSVAVD